MENTKELILTSNIRHLGKIKHTLKERSVCWKRKNNAGRYRHYKLKPVSILKLTAMSNKTSMHSLKLDYCNCTVSLCTVSKIWGLERELSWQQGLLWMHEDLSLIWRTLFKKWCGVARWKDGLDRSLGILCQPA